MAQPPPAPGAPPAPAPNPLAKRQEFLAGRRGEVKQAANAGLQQNNDAISRRFAAIGASGSGAQIAAGLKAQDQAASQERAGLNDLAGQEAQMLDADAGRELQASQFDRNLAQQGGQFDRNLDFQKDQFGKQFGLTAEQFVQDQQDNQFNALQSARQMGYDADLGGFIQGRYGTGLTAGTPMWSDTSAIARRANEIRNRVRGA